MANPEWDNYKVETARFVAGHFTQCGGIPVLYKWVVVAIVPNLKGKELCEKMADFIVRALNEGTEWEPGQ